MTKMILGRRVGILAVCLLALLQSLMRFAIAGSILLGNVDAWDEALDGPISNEMMLALNLTFILLAAFGILTAYGLWANRVWGFTGTIALSVVTILFDVWAMFEYQMSAVMGLLLPVLFIIYLLLIKDEYMQGVEQL